MTQQNIIEKLAKKLQESHPELSLYQALDIASKIQQCELTAAALTVNKRKSPVGLEAVGGALAQSPESIHY